MSAETQPRVEEFRLPNKLRLQDSGTTTNV